MDLRQLIALIPFAPARGPLLGLLARIEQAEQDREALALRLADTESRLATLEALIRARSTDRRQVPQVPPFPSRTDDQAATR